MNQNFSLNHNAAKSEIIYSTVKLSLIYRKSDLRANLDNIEMKFTDISNKKRIAKNPHNVEILLSNPLVYDDFQIKKIELREYIEKSDKKLGNYSLITTLVETDQGSIEMKYDEGYREANSLENTKKFLIQNLGLSGLILRSIIALKEEIKK